MFSLCFFFFFGRSFLCLVVFRVFRLCVRDAMLESRGSLLT